MAFRTQKISQMTPKGANLEATDLIEVSTIESGSYVTRSITGQEIIDAAVGNVDWGDIGGTLSNQTDLQNALNGKENTITAGTTSQYFRGDKTFQTLDKAAVGLGNVDNTSDLNKPISTATQTALNAKQNTLSLTTTGDNGASTLVGSTLNVPNYTLSGLGGVPTSRTLTINGVTQDLSANRTFTISTGITIGSTAIASGVVGRVLFEGAGNVVQESSSLFWDNTNARLGVGTSTPARRIDVLGSGDVLTGLKTTSATGAASHVVLNDVDSSFEFGMWGSTRTSYGAIFPNNAYIYGGVDFAITSLSNIKFGAGATPNERMRIVGGTGNVLIGTTTDAGFRLDVNGTARVQGNFTVTTSVTANTASSGTGYEGYKIQDGANARFVAERLITNFLGIGHNSVSGRWDDVLLGAAQRLYFYTGASERMRIFSTGNVGINTTTDAGFRLDVNGTARVQGVLTIGTELYLGNTTTGFFKSTNDFNFYNLANGSVKYRITGASQGFGISDNGYDTVAASAMLQVNSTTKGFLPPRMTQAQRNAIASPAIGLEIYQTDATEGKYIYKSSGWTYIG